MWLHQLSPISNGREPPVAKAGTAIIHRRGEASIRQQRLLLVVRAILSGTEDCIVLLGPLLATEGCCCQATRASISRQSLYPAPLAVLTC